MPSVIDKFQGDYRFLSNFYPSEIEYENLIYPTAEHAYQAAKTLDAAERESIRSACSPGKAKRLGKTVTLRNDLPWKNYKEAIMLDILAQKFEQPILKTLLLATNDAYLVEGNQWNDTEWGCIWDECGNLAGKNRLGTCLMIVRRRKGGYPLSDKYWENKPWKEV